MTFLARLPDLPRGRRILPDLRSPRRSELASGLGRGHKGAMPYSHPQALSREQALGRIRHLLPGALALAGVAGYMNSIALGVFKSPVSHMTGAVSYLGIDVADGRSSDAAATLSIILAFMVGACLAGFIIGSRELSPGRRFGATLILEGAILAVATYLLVSGRHSGVTLIAMACGLQNGTTSSYFGLMIRTTHVTGTVTDIGVMMGHWLRHRHVERRKLVFMMGVVAAFGTGVWIGALANARTGSIGLVVASLGLAAGGGAIMAFPAWFRGANPG
jgi:uncharacterized membrane protein YoaK (UPF0700 family)